MTPQTFLIHSPNGALRGDIYLPDAARGVPVVVCCHGFKGFKDWGFWPEVGRRFAANGIAVVVFNMSGSGIGEDPETFSETEAFENNTVAKELQDLGVVLEAVVSRQIPLGAADVRRLGVLGHSMGGGVGILRASRDPRIKALATSAAVARFQRWDAASTSAWRDQGFLPVENARTGQVFRLQLSFLEDIEAHADAYDIPTAASRIRVPYLIVHGTRDETVPVDDAGAIAEMGDRGYVRTMLVEGAGHTFGAAHPFAGTPPELERAITASGDWFLRAL